MRQRIIKESGPSNLMNLFIKSNECTLLTRKLIVLLKVGKENVYYSISAWLNIIIKLKKNER